ncbi:MAG: hypothetical protein V3575_05575 [Candidatus Absconditabacteria bacterium]
MKKILILLGVIFSFNFAFGAVTYNFSHYPVTNYKVDTHKKTASKEYYKYSGKSSFRPVYLDISEIQELVKDKGYFKHFRYAYYHKRLFDTFRDSRINLSRLSNTKLQYPIATVYVGDYLYIFIYYKNFTDRELDIIDDYYIGSNFALKSEGKRITTRLKINKSTKVDYRPYQYNKYFKPMSNLIDKQPVVEVQMGQNPLDVYNLGDDFGDYFIQYSVVQGGMMKGVLVSMRALFSGTDYRSSSTTIASQPKDSNYPKDVEMMKNLNSLYEAVNDYYNNTLALPKGITTLVPNYISLESFNYYNHKLKYQITSSFCFKAGMLPMSSDFKREYSTQVGSDGYIYVNYCIK